MLRSRLELIGDIDNIFKQEREPHEEDNRKTMAGSSDLSHQLAEFLRQEGYEAMGTAPKRDLPTEVMTEFVYPAIRAKP